jgi:hypothetical protein
MPRPSIPRPITATRSVRIIGDVDYLSVHVDEL